MPSLIAVNQNTSACWTLHSRDPLLLRLHHLMSRLIERLHCKCWFFLLIVIQWENNLFQLLLQRTTFIRSQVWNCHLVIAKICKRRTKHTSRPSQKNITHNQEFSFKNWRIWGRVQCTIVYMYMMFSFLPLFRVYIFVETVSVKAVTAQMFQLPKAWVISLIRRE